MDIVPFFETYVSWKFYFYLLKDIMLLNNIIIMYLLF